MNCCGRVLTLGFAKQNGKPPFPILFRDHKWCVASGSFICQPRGGGFASSFASWVACLEPVQRPVLQKRVQERDLYLLYENAPESCFVHLSRELRVTFPAMPCWPPWLLGKGWQRRQTEWGGEGSSHLYCVLKMTVLTVVEGRLQQTHARINLALQPKSSKGSRVPRFHFSLSGLDVPEIRTQETEQALLLEIIALRRESLRSW